MIKGERNKDISTKGEKLVYKEVMGEWNEDINDKERIDKGKGSIKTLSTQVGGASS